eukprot:365748-Chlamydomonas_euryale.AAC.6
MRGLNSCARIGVSMGSCLSQMSRYNETQRLIPARTGGIPSPRSAADSSSDAEPGLDRDDGQW